MLSYAGLLKSFLELIEYGEKVEHNTVYEEKVSSNNAEIYPLDSIKNYRKNP